jgi:hypothetical protein
MMKTFRVLACSLLLLLTLCVSSRPQDQQDASTPPPTPTGDPFDSFGKLCWEDEHARLDNFAVALMNTPDGIGQIIIYAGRKSCAGTAQARAMRMKKYLVERHNIEWNRVIWHDAGFLEEPYVVFWLAQRERLLPLPVPRAGTLSPTDAQVINCKPKRQRRTPR